MFALRFNSQNTRTVADQLFLLPPWRSSRRLWAGAASGGDGLPNSCSRRRRSPRVTDSPAPAHRRARDVQKKRQAVKKGLQKTRISTKSPTDYGTDPFNQNTGSFYTLQDALRDADLPVTYNNEGGPDDIKGQTHFYNDIQIWGVVDLQFNQ
jgi:hypothetical protein